MVALLLVVAMASLLLSRKAVQQNFETLLNNQFTELTNTVTAIRQQELEELAQTVADSAISPRLTAAFEIGQSDGYERFYYDLAEELEEIIQRFYTPESYYPPFFRFIDYEGHYLPPPGDLNQQIGLAIPNEESILAPIFTQFASAEYEDPEPRFGYSLLPTRVGEGIFEISVIPLFDGMGYLMGELVFAVSFSPESLNQFAWTGQSALYLDNKLFGGLGKETNERLLPQLQTYLSRNRNQDLRLSSEDEEYKVFTTLIQKDIHFPEAHLITVISMNEERQILRDIETALFSVTAFALILGLSLSLAAAQRLARRIGTLVEATRKIAGGDFTYRVNLGGGDEIATLGNAFNDMSQDLSLKEKYRAVLDKVTDKTVAEELTSGSIELGGEERTVTVLFCDIRQFTPLTRSKTARDIVELLNEHMTALTESVIRHEGVVDKFVGDEIMVLFGAPHARADDPERALKCAMEMLATRARLNQETDTPIQIGIGIATGKVVAGCMGSEDRLNYTVIGNAVNLAARLCSQAVAGQVLFDQATASRIKDFEVIQSLPVQLKGFTTRIPVFTTEPITVSAQA